MGFDDHKINYHEFNEKYISDGIKDDYKQWNKAYEKNSSTKVFLESPTGTGKTHFLINVLLKYAIEQKRSIIYICNRTALRKQIEQELMKAQYGLIQDSRFDNFNFSVFLYPGSTPYYMNNGIAIMNYQSVKNFDDICRSYGGIISNIFYIFLDEVHFFLEDALFNTETDYIRHYIFTTYQQQVQIFTSATILDFMDLYLDTYKAYLPSHPQANIYLSEFYHYHAEYYHNSFMRPAYNIILYTDETYLYEKIGKSKNEKWIIFVSSKVKGSEINKEISKSKKCILLSSNKKPSKTWETLMTECKFSQDVLIATKVIDNGVSIKDDNVRNIVVPFAYNTEFMQMIGRVRINDETPLPINLYVKLPTIQEIRSRRKKFESQLDLIYWIEDAHTMKYKIKMIKNYWNTEQFAHSFTFSYNNQALKLYTNPLLIYKLCTQIEFYNYLEEKKSETPKIYRDILMNWLGERIYNFENKWFFIDLIGFLDAYVGHTVKDTKQFYRDFLELYAAYCNMLFENSVIDEQGFAEKMKLRKGTGRNKSTINKALGNIELPYVIKKKNNCWIVEKIPQ